MKEFKPILWLIIVLIITALPLVFYVISGLANCPIIDSSQDSCQPLEQLIAGSLFLYSMFYLMILPLNLSVMIILFFLTLLMLLLEKRL